jgi:hypothetical protein
MMVMLSKMESMASLYSINSVLLSIDSATLTTDL